MTTIFITALLFLLKVFEAINISWWAVFSPLISMAGVWCLIQDVEHIKYLIESRGKQ